MKVCSICNEEKLKEAFHKDSSKKDGIRRECKACHKEGSKRYNSKPEVQLRKYKYNKKYYEDNKESISQQHALYYLVTRDEQRKTQQVYYKKYMKDNKSKLNAKDAKRRFFEVSASKVGSVLLGKLLIEEQYLIAETLSAVTGVKQEVDHIIPLIHGSVCGLHCVSNLRVIPASENRAKSNKLIEELL
jgi:hypothetical protein